MTDFLPNSGQHEVNYLKLKSYEINVNFQYTNLRTEGKKADNDKSSEIIIRQCSCK